MTLPQLPRARGVPRAPRVLTQWSDLTNSQLKEAILYYKRQPEHRNLRVSGTKEALLGQLMSLEFIWPIPEVVANEGNENGDGDANENNREVNLLAVADEGNGIAENKLDFNNDDVDNAVLNNNIPVDLNSQTVSSVISNSAENNL